jgi:Protease inhibitor Inh
LRDGGKDTGCMLTLDNRATGKGREKASLAPGCRDQGIVIFDPAGWQIVNGRLVLTARKGHKTYLDAQPDGSWKKDPKEGKSLTLKKL